MSSHAIGYHAFELAYLAHLYTRAYVSAGGGSDNSFCLYFKISSIEEQQSINVLPDFMPPGRVRITSVRANGVDVTEDLDPTCLVDYQIPTDDWCPMRRMGQLNLGSSSMPRLASVTERSDHRLALRSSAEPVGVGTS